MAAPYSVIPQIIARHHEEASFLWQLRQGVVVAADWSLQEVAELDERIETHLDGLRIAGEHGWKIAEGALESGHGELFVGGVLAIERRDRAGMASVVRAGAKSPETLVAVISSFERVSSRVLQGTVKELLASPSAVGRQVGLAACLRHGVNPGPSLAQLIDDTDADVSGLALQACGELGLLEYLPVVARERNHAQTSVQWWSEWSAVLLGNRGVALDAVGRRALEPGPHRSGALLLTLQAADVSAAHSTLQRFSREPKELRRLIQGSGIAGDPTYLPWLIGHMADAGMARVAGEAFTLVTGVELRPAALSGKRPDHVQSGPNDDPDDPNVDVDPDDGLPWPDPDRIKDWWAKNSSRFQPGTRYFMGAPVTREHCIEVLKNGYQRQRILAAHYLCLLNPGTPLFNTSAPAWRQQRLLAEMK
jgi:uncharacterized protein (TIGR02270 family)